MSDEIEIHLSNTLSKICVPLDEVEIELDVIHQKGLVLKDATFHLITTRADATFLNGGTAEYKLIIIDAKMLSVFRRDYEFVSHANLPCLFKTKTILVDYSLPILFNAINIYGTRGIEVTHPTLKTLFWHWSHISKPVNIVIGELDIKKATTATLFDDDTTTYQYYLQVVQLWDRLVPSLNELIVYLTKISSNDSAGTLCEYVMKMTYLSEINKTFIINMIACVEDLFSIPKVIYYLTDYIDLASNCQSCIRNTTDAEMFLYDVFDAIRNKLHINMFVVMILNLLSGLEYARRDDDDHSVTSDISEFSNPHEKECNKKQEDIVFIRRFQKFGFYFHKYLVRTFTEADIDAMIAEFQNKSGITDRPIYFNFKFAFDEFKKLYDTMMSNTGST